MLLFLLLEGEEEEEEEAEDLMGELKPIDPFSMRFWIILSRPIKAPAKMKRILSVRMEYVSGLPDPPPPPPPPVLGPVDEDAFGGGEEPDKGLLVGYALLKDAPPPPPPPLPLPLPLPPLADFSLFACICNVVPSMIFNSACCTPSPPTSFPFATFVVLILSISSRQMIPRSAAATS